MYIRHNHICADNVVLIAVASETIQHEVLLVLVKYMVLLIHCVYTLYVRIHIYIYIHVRVYVCKSINMYIYNIVFKCIIYVNTNMCKSIHIYMINTIV